MLQDIEFMVKIDEVFPNPTVKKVIFHMSYSNLFYIENKIGEFQTKIMHIFPNSSIEYRNRLILVDKGGKIDATDIEKMSDDDFKAKVWQFESETGMKLNVMSNSLSIISERHKTYNNKKEKERFRDIIEEVTKIFFEIIPLTILKTVGLRYIDECPIPDPKNINNKSFKQWYNTTFDLNQFNLSNTKEIATINIHKNEECFIRFIERFKKNDSYSYILDFDGFAENVKKEQYLQITDKLHDLIANLYCNIIKEPIIEYMKKPKEG